MASSIITTAVSAKWGYNLAQGRRDKKEGQIADVQFFFHPSLGPSWSVDSCWEPLKRKKLQPRGAVANSRALNQRKFRLFLRIQEHATTSISQRGYVSCLRRAVLVTDLHNGLDLPPEFRLPYGNLAEQDKCRGSGIYFPSPSLTLRFDSPSQGLWQG